MPNKLTQEQFIEKATESLKTMLKVQVSPDE